jgi:hypothetical protein
MGVMAHRGVSFFESEDYLITDKGAGQAAPAAEALDPGLC